MTLSQDQLDVRIPAYFNQLVTDSTIARTDVIGSGSGAAQSWALSAI